MTRSAWARARPLSPRAFSAAVVGLRRVDADVLYAKHWSFMGHVAIMVRTLPLLLARVNAY